MIVEPGEYVATLPSDPDRMTEAQEWLKGADGKLLDWGFGESGGIDVKFRTGKAAEWPAEIPAPRLISKGALVHQPAPPKPKRTKRKRRKAKGPNLGAIALLWLLTKGSS